MNDFDVEKQNQQFAQISKTLFDGKAELRIVKPGSLVLLARNARYFKKEIFRQLVSNIKKDSRLSSVPLCWVREDGKLEVLSGNHRVKASIEAGLDYILVFVVTEKLDREQQIAIQLSHNSLVGEDDQKILSELWSEMETLEAKLYAGLSSDTLAEIGKVDLLTFTTPAVATRTVSFSFVSTEADRFEQVIDELDFAPQGTVYLAHLAQWDSFFQNICAIKEKFEIKSASLAILKMLELTELALEAGLGRGTEMKKPDVRVQS